MLGNQLLRSRNAGIELVDRDGTATPLLPPPLDEWFLGSYVTTVIDGPTIAPQAPAPPVARSVEQPILTAAPEVEHAADDETPDDGTSKLPFAVGAALVVIAIAALAWRRRPSRRPPARSAF